MTNRRLFLSLSVAAAAAVALSTPTTAAALVAPDDGGTAGPATVRFSQFNVSLFRATEGELTADLSTPDDTQAQNVAEIVQRVRPDVLLLNEFDYVAPTDPDDPFTSAPVAGFVDNYLSRSQGGADPIDYPYAYVAPSNTGVPSGLDLNRDGTVGGGDDALGFGVFPGQYGMLVLSQHPIDTGGVRSFQNFLWRDMPGALLPDDAATPEPGDYFSKAALDVLPLSSKSHWDVPVLVGGTTIHLLASHPTPPVFDGPEDRNGRRNHDEIRFWADYVTPGRTSSYIYDDEGGRGGIERGARFVVAGDQNADPVDGDSVPGAIQQLLDSRRISSRVTPAAPGGVEAAAVQGGVNLEHLGDPATDTADFSDGPGTSGNLRADYVLPSRGLRASGAGIFWPASDDPLYRLTGTFPFPSSDHRMVWIDLQVPGR